MPSSLIVSMISKIRSTKIGASPSDGSSRSSSFGRAISARPIAHICCSPPDMVPAFWSLALVQSREELEDVLHVGADAGAVGALERAHLEVLGHRHAREEPPPLRRLRDAPLDDLDGPAPT